MKTSKNQQRFLLTFFPDKKEYMEVQVNGYWLVHSHNNGKWIVSVYTQESFERYKEFITYE